MDTTRTRPSSSRISVESVPGPDRPGGVASTALPIGMRNEPRRPEDRVEAEVEDTPYRLVIGCSRDDR